MPFDAMVAVTRQAAISDALERHCLTPVPWDVLAVYKQAQRQRFGPSFWHRHQAALAIALVIASPVVGAAAGATDGFTPHASALMVASSLVWMCTVALITGAGLIRLRAGSHWEERLVPASFLGGHDVPEPIARVARLLQADVPGCMLILGELKREETVLDPYLLLAHGNERVCVGIWENDRVVACAQ